MIEFPQDYECRDDLKNLSLIRGQGTPTLDADCGRISFDETLETPSWVWVEENSIMECHEPRFFQKIVLYKKANN